MVYWYVKMTNKKKKVDCDTPIIPEDVCTLENPFQDMFDYQNECIEREQPDAFPLWNAIMWAGDIYRGTSEKIFPYGYIYEKLNKSLITVMNWEEYHTSHITKDLSPEKIKQLKSFREKLEDWEKFTKNHPECDMPKRRELQLKAIEMEKLLTNFGLTLTDLSEKENTMFVTDLFRDRFGKLHRKMKTLFTEAYKEEREPPARE